MGVGLIASPILASAADDNLIEAVAAQEEAELAVAAASVVKETLAPALNEYCFAMDRCAGEFEKLASECASFADKGKRFAETEKRAFFKLMQGRATAIFDSVKAFQMVAISAEIDLECLPAADDNLIEAVAAQEGAELAVAAASVVKETLAPALNEHCFAMDRCAGEFEKLTSECASFADKGKRFAETEKRAFFKLMQGLTSHIRQRESVPDGCH